jgi:predicted AlkP superfamily phosphohydrolase/phosphomutase
MVGEGRLPNLRYLMKRGAWGTLKSTVPPVTPSAWTSFFTGKNAGKHGIYDFQEIDPETYEFHTVRTDRHREETVWELLGEVGLQAIITDVPFTYPPRPLNGWMITGYGTPRTQDTVITYPPDLADHVPADLRSEIKVALPTNKFERSRRFIEEWEDVMEGRRRLLGYLMTERPWDLFMHVFSITDTAAHVFWTYVDPAHPNYYKPEGETYREAFLRGYETCDQILGEMMELAGSDTTVLVLSDHGFGSVRPRQYVFQRLMKGGYVRGKGKSSLQRRLLQLAVGAYNRFPILREWAKNLQPSNREVVKNTLRRAQLLPNTRNIDYTRSKVVPANFGLRMWVNEQGRFAQGIVPSDQREALLAELSDFLTADRDKVTGRPIIARTYRGSELYHGPYAAKGPDLVIEYANFYDPAGSHHPENPFLEGGHTLDGIFLAYGPDVQAVHLQPANLIDVAPTILQLFDQPIPPDMDGHVLTEAFKPDFLQRQPVKYDSELAQRDKANASSGYSDEEEAELREQLRQLGYI